MEAEKKNYNELLRQTLDHICLLSSADKTTIKLPHPEGSWEPHKNMLFHTSYEIFYQINGGCRFTFPKEEKIIYPGEILMVPPGTPHVEHSFSLNGKKFCNLVFIISKNSLTIHIARSGVPGLRFDEPEPAHVVRFEAPKYKLYWTLSGMMADRTSLTSESEQRCISRFHAFQTISAMAVEEIMNSNEESHEHYKINMVKAIIGWSAMNAIPTVSELGRRVGLSANYLSWLFHKETGETLKGHINRIRIEQAENMLRTTAKSIAEIAWMCGFRDPAYFSRIFERHNGKKPFEYRSQVR